MTVQPRPGSSKEITPMHPDLLALATYQGLFEDINNNHPEGDVRQRFLGARAVRAQYVEAVVWDRQRANERVLMEAREKPADCEDEERLKRFHQTVIDLDEALQWYSRVNDEDSKASTAPLVDEFFMDNIFRHHLEEAGKACQQAPNGELRTIYGTFGDRVSSTFMAPRGCDDDFLRRLITRKLMHPFNKWVFKPLQRRYNRILGRAVEQEAQGLSGKTLRILVSALECAIAVGCLATSVMLLYNIETTKKRLIAAPFLSLTFTIPVIFLSREAMRTFTLAAANWAVLIVFLSTNGLNSS